MGRTRKHRSEPEGPRFTAADLIVPWQRADRLDSAIQEIVRRWLARSLLVTMAGCSAGHDHSSAVLQSTIMNAPHTSDAGPRVSSQPMRPALDASSSPAVPATLDAGRAPSDVAPTPADAAAIDAGPTDPLAPFAPPLLAAGSGFDPIDCDAAGQWDPMPHVKPSQAFDYAALRRVLSSYRSDGGIVASDGGVTDESHVGTACVNATDASACATALDAPLTMPERNHCGMGGCLSYFISTTLGDMVQRWSSREEVLAFLGPIDSPEDAIFMVFYDGYRVGHAVDGGCDTAAVRKVDDGYEVYATAMTSSCPIKRSRYLLHVASDGVITILRSAEASEDGGCIGRRPAGLEADDVAAGSALGTFFARHAQLEAASVHAFEHMIAELITHGAPRELVEQAHAARVDEIRHATLVGELARKHRATVPALHVAAPAPRSLLAMAIENATEGCVRETWGALLGTYQAQNAPDPEIAAVLLEIAADERRHATLSWRVAAWLEMQLTLAERAQVAAASRAAIATLREEEAWPKSNAVSRAVGLPNPAAALALLDELDAQFWAAA